MALVASSAARIGVRIHRPRSRRHRHGRTRRPSWKPPRERGKDGLDTFLDLTLEDDLDIEFVLAQYNCNIKAVQETLTDPRVLIALGDGGAHVDMLCDAGYPTYLLGTWVRERQALTWEPAITRLDIPAG